MFALVVEKLHEKSNMDILTSPLEYEENSFDVDCFESIVHHMISNSIYINI